MATQKSAVRGALTSIQPSPAPTPLKAEAEETATPYSQALSRLEPLQPVLAGLAHRNHNQHRRAAWWRSFGLLRRNCARLVEHLIAAVAAARKNAARAARAAKAQSKKRRREELVSGSLGTGALSAVGTGVCVAADVNVTRHANWLRDVLIPKCYLAFSQLTADSQFAPIGVVLLGILAQVQAACDYATPRSAATAATPESSPSAREIPAVSVEPKPNVENTASLPIAGNAMALPASGSKSQTNDTKKVPRGERDASAAGGGKAISREDVERAAELLGKGKGVEKAQQRGKPEREAKPTTITNPEKSITLSRATKATSPASSSKRQVVSAQDGGEPEVVRPVKKVKVKTAQVPREREDGKRNDKDSKDKEKKKKKKAKKGDEFDDLFKGLF